MQLFKIHFFFLYYMIHELCVDIYIYKERKFMLLNRHHCHCYCYEECKK